MGGGLLVVSPGDVSVYEPEAITVRSEHAFAFNRCSRLGCYVEVSQLFSRQGQVVTVNRISGARVQSADTAALYVMVSHSTPMLDGCTHQARSKIRAQARGFPGRSCRGV